MAIGHVAGQDACRLPNTAESKNRLATGRKAWEVFNSGTTMLISVNIDRNPLAESKKKPRL